MQRAETKAAQVSPKLTVVMIVFILPTLLIVLLGPAAVRMKNILLPTAQDQGVAP
jgi:tight adherence protein C